MTSQNQLIKWTAAMSAILIILGTAVFLYFPDWYRADEKRVLLCGKTIEDQSEPILKLEGEECEAIIQNVDMYENLPREQDVTAFDEQRLRVEIGKAPPVGTRLELLPKAVTTQFPDLTRYRYFISGDNVALVDPAKARIVAFVGVQESHRQKGE
ncbi:protein of unknown function [Candidatus Filomicrobium marinum]|uniref:Uncharacterized protein n=1 Tax=Candidatus Filomicrobium marinum TaxID=1608628 RepID=A0A0D6JB33_9HYPH|nr:hypothetical protein [Candidatus Filomicrobium marinum]CFX04519.1 protein of unknown function [Candidatus Filomicrobium marinum]CPR16075.1 protein of unknown function [Candidatus Filomicrobium marinum]